MGLTRTRLIERGKKLFSESTFALAADLGQSTDPSAVAICEHVRHIEVDWKGRENPIGVSFDIRYLRRLPLGSSYVDQVGEIRRLLARPPLNAGCEFAIDETGVGRAVGDLFDSAGTKPTRITITSGDKQSSRGARRWHVPKQLLISSLDARLHTGELRFASELSEAAAMAEELKDFHRHVSAAGRYSFAARATKHDDLVLAVALSLWMFAGKPREQPVQVGTYSQSGNPVRWND